MAQSARIAGMMQRAGAAQFVKFCTVGFTSMLVDVGISGRLTLEAHWNWIVARSLSFSLAVVNGYLWNSLWTFRGQGAGGHHTRLARFFAVNLIGLALNLAIMKVVLAALQGRWYQSGTPSKLHWYVAVSFAVALVSVWNFIGSKKWTFAG
ncbi:MAG TPA: GtrA family protein [Chthonomonadales bacterium]|nr:GtrA family protein [Chthonomonadales bacterium]